MLVLGGEQAVPQWKYAGEVVEMNAIKKTAFSFLVMVAMAGCGSIVGSPNPPAGNPASVLVKRTSGSLGPILSTSDGGQIFGFDINQNGNDGVLASALFGVDISVQTFDETSGAITKTFGVKKGRAVYKGDDYVVDGIFAHDVALVDFQRAGKPGKTAAHDIYSTMDPVTAGTFTGKWKPTIELFNVLQNGVNQSTTTSVVFGYERIYSDPPELVVSNIAKNTVSKVIALDPNQFSLEYQPQLAQDTVHNLAVMATSPSAGRAGGPPPVIATINLRTGKATEFNGVACPGSVGCGSANGIAYDSKSGIACTTTELDGGVEFYDVAQQSGFHVYLPNGGGQSVAGTYVASDPIHKLFLIAQPVSSTSSGSSIQVYDENGTFVESINGLNFPGAQIAINPNNRTGWVNGPSFSQLQEFSY
jgi:hypothetical protein